MKNAGKKIAFSSTRKEKRQKDIILLEKIVKENPGITLRELSRAVGLSFTTAGVLLFYVANVYQDGDKLYFYDWKAKK